MSLLLLRQFKLKLAEAILGDVKVTFDCNIGCSLNLSNIRFN